MLWISVVVFAVVSGMLIVAAVRGRRASDLSLDRRVISWGEPFIAIAGVLLPFFILGGVYLLSLREMNSLAAGGKGANLTIEVIGHDWWWEIRYPNGAVTANEIHIPVGEPVRVELSTKDVIHSFWVPQLQVKTDQIPGRKTVTWLQADGRGPYRGQCAEYCGLQHTNMVFYVIGEDPEEGFPLWLDEQAADAREPTTASQRAGRQVFLDSSCVGCHTIRGTEAEGTLGPDLTHLASRMTIAGVFDNTRENRERQNLMRFVANPHDSKPGVVMPPAELTDQELRLLVDYLESLE